MNVYQCLCCSIRGEKLCTRCVFSACRRCLMCFAHCTCPERNARGCGEDVELFADNGPFGFKTSMEPVDNGRA